jgi:hypothetical protein
MYCPAIVQRWRKPSGHPRTVSLIQFVVQTAFITEWALADGSGPVPYSDGFVLGSVVYLLTARNTFGP